MPTSGRRASRGQGPLGFLKGPTAPKLDLQLPYTGSPSLCQCGPHGKGGDLRAWCGEHVEHTHVATWGITSYCVPCTCGLQKLSLCRSWGCWGEVGLGGLVL